MNISSAIAYAKKGKEAADVAKKIDKIEGCEVVAAQEGKIVVGFQYTGKNRILSHLERSLDRKSVV